MGKLNSTALQGFLSTASYSPDNELAKALKNLSPPNQTSNPTGFPPPPIPSNLGEMRQRVPIDNVQNYGQSGQGEQLFYNVVNPTSFQFSEGGAVEKKQENNPLELLYLLNSLSGL